MDIFNDFSSIEEEQIWSWGEEKSGSTEAKLSF